MEIWVCGRDPLEFIGSGSVWAGQGVVLHEFCWLSVVCCQTPGMAFSLSLCTTYSTTGKGESVAGIFESGEIECLSNWFTYSRIDT